MSSNEIETPQSEDDLVASDEDTTLVDATLVTSDLVDDLVSDFAVPETTVIEVTSPKSGRPYKFHFRNLGSYQESITFAKRAKMWIKARQHGAYPPAWVPFLSKTADGKVITTEDELSAVFYISELSSAPTKLTAFDVVRMLRSSTLITDIMQELDKMRYGTEAAQVLEAIEEKKSN